MSEMKPCPFCGNKALTNIFLDYEDIENLPTNVIDDYEPEVTCENERCIYGWWLSPKDWNTRPIEDALNARIAELEAAQRWRVVADGELPEFGTSILFYDSILEKINKGTCTALDRDKTNLQWITDDGLYYHGNRCEYITHWMPLPQPPEVQK